MLGGGGGGHLNNTLLQLYMQAEIVITIVTHTSYCYTQLHWCLSHT